LVRADHRIKNHACVVLLLSPRLLAGAGYGMCGLVLMNDLLRLAAEEYVFR
jgi:hypothetical protein